MLPTTGLNESNHQSKKPEGRFGVEGDWEGGAETQLNLPSDGDDDMGGGHGDGDDDGAPIEDRKNDEDRGDSGSSSRAVGTGRVSTTGVGRSAAHFVTRSLSLRSCSGEMNSDFGASREATQVAPRKLVDGRAFEGVTRTASAGTIGRGPGIETLRTGRLGVHGGGAVAKGSSRGNRASDGKRRRTKDNG